MALVIMRCIPHISPFRIIVARKGSSTAILLVKVLQPVSGGK